MDIISAREIFTAVVQSKQQFCSSKFRCPSARYFELRTRSVISFTSAEDKFSYKPQIGLACGVLAWRSQMAAIARVLSRASGTEVDVETIKTLAMFCGVGLTVSLLLASYGLDLSAGFF
jgi:predicted molibdopterin-dependent oxidoreductase YjgC